MNYYFTFRGDIIKALGLAYRHLKAIDKTVQRRGINETHALIQILLGIKTQQEHQRLVVIILPFRRDAEHKIQYNKAVLFFFTSQLNFAKHCPS